MSNYPFKVIEIIDETRIIINAGEYDDIAIGQPLNIVKKGNPVRDLDGQELGTYDLIIERIIVAELFERFSVCIKDSSETSEEYLSPLKIYAAAMAGNPQKMHVNREKATNRSFPSNKIIEVGDEVIFARWFYGKHTI